jgi:hypothetical protein
MGIKSNITAIKINLGLLITVDLLGATYEDFERVNIIDNRFMRSKRSVSANRATMIF